MEVCCGRRLRAKLELGQKWPIQVVAELDNSSANIFALQVARRPGPRAQFGVGAGAGGLVYLSRGGISV